MPPIATALGAGGEGKEGKQVKQGKRVDGELLGQVCPHLGRCPRRVDNSSPEVKNEWKTSYR